MVKVKYGVIVNHQSIVFVLTSQISPWWAFNAHVKPSNSLGRIDHTAACKPHNQLGVLSRYRADPLLLSQFHNVNVTNMSETESIDGRTGFYLDDRGWVIRTWRLHIVT